ncbi:MAG: DUF3291 domain-containing protein [Myxococcales bacterium]|nr:DUF3291 domain-containing protein [Myxococcales bacterium]
MSESPKFELAQINIARFREPWEHPVNKPFIEAIEHVNALAEESPGFVWRLIGDGQDATDIRPDADDQQLLVNLSVWIDIDALSEFVYGNKQHRHVMKRRSEWFDHMEAYMALWWVPAGDRPTVKEGMGRIKKLHVDGPSPEAFTFRISFPPPLNLL